MTRAEKKKLLATNAGIWVAGILASYVLPLVAESMSDGPAGFLKLMCFAFPLFVAMFFSNSVIGNAIGDPTD